MPRYGSIAPLLAQVSAAAPDDLHRREKAAGESRSRARSRRLRAASRYVDHRVLVDRCDLLRDELDVARRSAASQLPLSWVDRLAVDRQAGTTFARRSASSPTCDAVRRGSPRCRSFRSLTAAKPRPGRVRRQDRQHRVRARVEQQEAQPARVIRYGDGAPTGAALTPSWKVFGNIHTGERWNTAQYVRRRRNCGWSSWKASAPVPMTAMRLLAVEWSLQHAPVCATRPGTVEPRMFGAGTAMCRPPPR